MFDFRVRQNELADQETFSGYSSRKTAVAGFKRRFANWRNLGCRIYDDGKVVSAKSPQAVRFGKPSIYDQVADLYQF